MTLETYIKQLDIWAEQEREQAALAKQAGNEREHSICLMKASMMGDMLKVLGRVELTQKNGILEKIARQNMDEAARLRALGDFDAAERSEIKAQTIRRAQALLSEKE